MFVKLVLIFILCFAGVKIWYARLERRIQDTTAPGQMIAVKEEEPKTEPLRKTDDYTIIVSRNIFQAVITEADKVVEEVEPEVLEPTKLKLSLMGTVSSTEQNSRAIISDDLKREQDIYQVGDSIQGALIVGIERGRVILKVNGVDEILSLKDREGGGPAYEPSPADFYEEPPEMAEPSAQVENQEPAAPARNQPAVRPGPSARRRNIVPRNTPNMINQQ